MPEELKNKGFGFLPILLIAAVIGTASIIGFNTFSPTNNSSDVLAATSGTTILDCIKNPAAPACASSYQTVKVNTKFYQNVNDTKPPWWRPIKKVENTENQYDENHPCRRFGVDSAECKNWNAFTAYCDGIGRTNRDDNCKAYLKTKGIDLVSTRDDFVAFCKSSAGANDSRCIDNGIYCEANPNTKVCICKREPQNSICTETPLGDDKKEEGKKGEDKCPAGQYDVRAKSTDSKQCRTCTGNCSVKTSCGTGEIFSAKVYNSSNVLCVKDDSGTVNKTPCPATQVSVDVVQFIAGTGMSKVTGNKCVDKTSPEVKKCNLKFEVPETNTATGLTVCKPKNIPACDFSKEYIEVSASGAYTCKAISPICPSYAGLFTENGVAMCKLKDGYIFSETNECGLGTSPVEYSSYFGKTVCKKAIQSALDYGQSGIDTVLDYGQSGIDTVWNWWNQ